MIKDGWINGGWCKLFFACRPESLCCLNGNYARNLGFLCYRGKRWPVTAAAHGGADRRARWNPLSFRALLLHLSEPLCKPEVQFPWSSFLLCINHKQPSPSHIQAPAPFQLHQPCWLERRETPSMLLLCVYVDITSRLFGCVCQSVLTERNTGIYPAITTVSGQALCRNWVGDVSVISEWECTYML